MTTKSNISSVANPQASVKQIYEFQQKQGTREEADSLILESALLTQSAGILLRLPQEVIATSIVILQRYLLSSVSDERLQYDVKKASAASVYLCAKESFYPLAPRSIINVYAYLDARNSVIWPDNLPNAEPSDPKSYYVSEGTYERERLRLFDCETRILAALGFDTKVVLPYSLALTYLQALNVRKEEVAQRTFEHLNGALLAPQLLYLTHQPNELAVAAIYLAAKEMGAKLVDENWWEVFNVDREDLGFLVLSYGSLVEYARVEKQKLMSQQQEQILT